MVKKLAFLMVSILCLWGFSDCCWHCNDDKPPICNIKTYPITVYLQIVDAKTDENLVGKNQVYHPDSVTFTTTYAGGRIEASTPIKMVNMGTKLGYVMVLNLDTYILKGDFYLNKDEKGFFTNEVQYMGESCKFLPTTKLQYTDNKIDLTLHTKGTELRSEPILFQIKK